MVVFPRISIKTNAGALIVRETETVLGEKITTRTEEVPCPETGIPHLRTVEVVEKLIETEVDYHKIRVCQRVHLHKLYAALTLQNNFTVVNSL